MANQITIDIGAAANDGTGDPLRTAFNYVNNNFSNVWNTGLPNSNVQFSDNRILTVNTNANLVLAPNGIGKVASNVDIVPNTANVFGLGSPTRRWNTVYGQYLDLSHNATIGGNLVVTGNLSAGNISYTSNVFVGDLEGSVFDGASSIVLDVIDSAIYVDNYRYANGVPVTFGGNYSNANVAAYLPTYTGNLSANNISAGNVFTASTITSNDAYINTGTFSGDTGTGNDSLYVGAPTFTVLGTDIMAQFTGNVTNYGQINFQNYSNSVTASGDYIITSDNGNDSTHYIDMGMTSSTWDGSQTNVLDGLAPNNGYLYVQDGNLTLGTRNGNTSYTWNFDTAGNLSIPGTITTDNTEFTLTVGISEWVFDETGVLTAPGEIETVGNISAGYFLGNGSQLTGIVSSYGNANVATYLPTYTGNIGAGNIAFTNNYVYSGNTFTSPETNGILKNFKWEFSDLSSGADTVTLQWNLLDTTFPQWYLTTNSQGNTYAFDGDAKTLGFLDNSINSGTVTFGTAAANGAGGSNDIELTTVTGNAYVRTGSNSWKFDNTGNLTLPDGYTFGPSGSSLLIGAPDTTDGIYMDWASEISFFIGNAGGENIAQIGTLGGVWAFGNDGVLTAPGNIVTTGNITGGNISTGGRVSATGNIVTGGQIQSSAFTGGNISWSANSQVDFQGAIKVGGTGVIKSPGGASSITLNNNGANIPILGVTNTGVSTSTTTGALIVSGGAGIAGNVNIGGLANVTGNVSANIIAANNNDGTGQNIKVGDDTWLGDINISNTLSIRGQQDGANAYIVFGNASNVALGRAGTGPLTYGGDFSVSGNITGNVGGYEIGYRNIPQLVFAGDVQVSADDAGKHYYNASNTAYTMSLVDSGAVTYPVGMAVTIVNKGTGNIAVDAFPGVSLYLAGNATAGNRVVTSYGMATVLNVATDVWFISGAGVE